ncbi:hypothetical protein BC833DRAFT_596062, partial [Globomyces pollinis-pini]
MAEERLIDTMFENRIEDFAYYQTIGGKKCPTIDKSLLKDIDAVKLERLDYLGSMDTIVEQSQRNSLIDKTCDIAPESNTVDCSDKQAEFLRDWMGIATTECLTDTYQLHGLKPLDAELQSVDPIDLLEEDMGESICSISGEVFLQKNYISKSHGRLDRSSIVTLPDKNSSVGPDASNPNIQQSIVDVLVEDTASEI